MLARIPKSEIKRGMFVEAVECPAALFGKRRFLVNSDSDFNAILNSPAKFVLINTAMGADSAKAKNSAMKQGFGEPLSPAEARAEAKATLNRSVKVLKSELIKMVTGCAFDMASISPLAKEIAQADTETSNLYFEVSRLKNKDETTFQHSLAVGNLMGQLAKELDLDSSTVELLIVSGWLHDVGKLTIPNSILLKQSPLTDEERRLLQTHPRRGHKMLQHHASIPDEALEICLHHHEALDGSGYPSRMSGSQIGQLIRISTVCDVFDALTTARPYKRGWATSDALAWMFDRHEKFDRKLVLRLGAGING